MGNRLGSPRKRKPVSSVATANVPVAAEVAASPEAVLHQHDARRPTSPVMTKIDSAAVLPMCAEPGETPRTPRSQHPWQLVPSALHVVDVFTQPVREEQERQRQRRERLMLVNGDPDIFFAVHSIQHQAPLTLEDASLWYSNALMLKARGDVVAATQQLRLVATSDTSLVAAAQAHLAQCLLLQDPTLETHGQEIQRLLVECTANGEHAMTLDPDLRSAATELLAHVLMARGSFREACEMLTGHVGLAASPPAADVLFALASCEHQLKDPVSSSNQARDELLHTLVSLHSDCKEAPALALLRAEAGAILAGPYM